MLAIVVSIVAGACVPPPSTATQPERNPIVVIHGWQFFCGSEDAATWKVWLDEARGRGYREDQLAVFSYDTCQPNATSMVGFASLVDDVLARTGARQVDVLAHSMGSLIARACIRFGDCGGKVDQLMSVAGANHGTFWANACELAFWSRSTCDMKPDGPFLAALNGGDETWGDVEYRTMTSWCDLTIVPFTSTALQGAHNTVDERCLSHTDWRNDPVGAASTISWFDRAV